MNLVDFIENRLTEAFDINELAKQAFFSKTHYQRLFHAIVGEPVMEYVRNRRLQLASRDVRAGKDGILSIALKYGYDSHEGFTRAFKSYFGASPSEYRKRGKSNETEAIKMLSNVVLNRIGQNAEKIYAALSRFITEAGELTARAHKTAEAAGNKGITTAIVADELNNLSMRAGEGKEELKNFTTVNISAFEMFEKIYALIRVIDDIVFQMNLLRFFSGIETGRIAPPNELGAFTEIDEGYVMLFNKIANEKKTMAALMHEAVEVLYLDIEQEAEGCIKSFVNAINDAIAEGGKTTAFANAAAESLGKHGGAFSHIAKETGMTLDALKSSADDFKNIRKLVNMAYTMNINAFNAAIETARAGKPAECIAAADSIMKYADTLQKTCQKCEALYAEYERLIELTNRNGKQSEQSLMEKHIDDTIFQSKILSSHFALEAKRSKRDALQGLAQSATEAHFQFERTRDFSEYRKSVTAFLTKLNEEISLSDIGGSFTYFAKEYGYFAAKISHISSGEIPLA